MIHPYRHLSILARSGLAAALSLMPASVSAYEAETKTAPLILAQADQFGDATIEAFAVAQARVTEIQAFYSAQYDLVETDEQRMRISGRATEEMISAVEETPNISLEEYNAIIEAAGQDAALLERINDAIADRDT